MSERTTETLNDPAAETAAPGMRKDLDALREEFEGRRGRDLWRSLEELAGEPAFEELVHREFPEQAAEWASGVDRRRFLQLMSASLAFGGLAACTRQPLEKIVPYVKQPEEIVPGRPLFFATGMELDGYAYGLLAESHMGRPTKIEGNPEHPASLGATGLYPQASILDLYDPDRPQTVTHLGRIRTWEDFAEEIAGVVEAQRAIGGEGLRILSGTVTSPTQADQIERLLTELPRARWHRWEAVGHDEVRNGSRLAFGSSVAARYDFARARVVVGLEADFAADGPGAVRYARDFARARRVRENDTGMSRYYAVESAATTTATLADHRLPLSATEVAQFAIALAAEVEVPGATMPSGLGEGARKLARAAAADLRARPGAGLVIVGRQSPAALHAIAHAINHQLGNLGSTVEITEPIEPAIAERAGTLAELVTAMRAGAVDTLLVLDGNPVYDAPADLDFLSAFEQVPRRIRLGLYDNETSQYCHWNLPAAHYLEAWADNRAYDGTVTVTQPLIEPLNDGRSATEVLSVLADGGMKRSEQLIRGYWRGRLGVDAAKAWRRAVHDGMVADTAAAAVTVEIDSAGVQRALRALAAQTGPSGDEVELIFRPDPTIYDGRFNNNGWLQECPKPLTKLTWDNAALVSPALAGERGLEQGQMVRLEAEGRALDLPIWILPGQPRNTVTVTLGYGRAATGRVGTGTGFDVNRLRSSASPWALAGATLTPLAERYELASTQLHSNIAQEGEQAEKRHLVRVGTVEEFEHHPEFVQHVGHGIDESLSLMPGFTYDGHAWGLAVDLSACTGCNACVVACQSENNIPIVGKEQVALGREMHWLRIDRYYAGDPEAPEVHHQPVMCMHCEQAPCEIVCPVSATVHSSEGLNDMVYNRCVGTRYCSNNCPYKVRRFNFLKWNDTETPILKLLRNPDVTVRSRGVMEKCSYCVQRINAVRIDSRRENRRIADGEIQTACQQTCASEAIVFGDLNDPDSRVAKRKSQPLDYGILSELGTRPRTTYLAKITNPSPELGGADGSHGADRHAEESEA